MRGTLLFCLLFFLSSVFFASAQDEENIDDLFDDPTIGEAEEDEENIDDLFDDPTIEEADEGKPIDDSELELFDSRGLEWGGELTSILGGQHWYDNKRDSLTLSIIGKLYFDARPDKNFSVYGKLTTAYPFYSSIKTPLDPYELPGSTNPLQTWTINDIKIFELFSDFNIGQILYFRFGKQVAGWGLSRFYQVSDPLSIAVLDPENPEDDLEGPVALKATLPLGLHNLYFYTIVKESYLMPNIYETTPADLGYGIKGDFLIDIPENPVIGNAEINLGAYYQKDLAPKFIAGVTTNISNFQIFSDQIVSWGLDNYRLTDDIEGTLPGDIPYYGSEKSTEGLFYSATAGIMYINNELNFIIYGEYLFLGSGTLDPDYYEKLYNRYITEKTAEQMGITIEKNLVPYDLLAHQGMHNTTFSLLLNELFGTDKLTFSIFWQANWVDISGLIVPGFTFNLNDYFSITAGTRITYGKDKSEFVLKMIDPVTLEPERLLFYLDLSLGSGKF